MAVKGKPRMSNTSGSSEPSPVAATDWPVLVPRREDGGARDAVWKRLQEDVWSRWRIVEGHHDGPGPFNRAAALNTAAELAGLWDVAVIADADSMVDQAQLVDAVRLAGESQRLVIAHDRWVNVHPDEHDHFLRTGALRWRDGRLICSMTVSSMLAVPRSVWDQVEGFDEAFAGYGFEDNAFARACRMLTGEPLRMFGTVYHLSHEDKRPGLTEQLRADPQVRANKQRWMRYAAAKRPDQIRAVRAS
jgi:hypothetical protein